MISARSSRPKSSIRSSQPLFHTNMASSIPTSTMSVNNQNAVPYSHLPLPNEPSGLYDTLITTSDMALAKKKFVKVSSTGEVEVEPDKIEFCIQITSSKSDIAQSKLSIKKREDYILAALKKYKIRDEDVIASTIIKKYDPKLTEEEELDFQENQIQEVMLLKELKKIPLLAHEMENPNGNNNNNNGKERLEFIREICVSCDNLMSYLQMYSTCNEKLDRHVIVSQPVVRFTPNYMQINTQKAVRLAMNNGTLKATELLNSMKRRIALGRLYYSVEDSLTIEEVEDYNKGLPTKFETFSWKRLNKVIKCTLTSVFELESTRTRKVI